LFWKSFYRTIFNLFCTLTTQQHNCTLQVGLWESNAGFQTHTHFLSLNEWDILQVAAAVVALVWCAVAVVSQLLLLHSLSLNEWNILQVPCLFVLLFVFAGVLLEILF
jgi:hypothetical protein